jgi:hypothetical protein
MMDLPLMIKKPIKIIKISNLIQKYLNYLKNVLKWFDNY